MLQYHSQQRLCIKHGTSFLGNAHVPKHRLENTTTSYVEMDLADLYPSSANNRFAGTMNILSNRNQQQRNSQGTNDQLTTKATEMYDMQLVGIQADVPIQRNRADDARPASKLPAQILARELMESSANEERITELSEQHARLRARAGPVGIGWRKDAEQSKVCNNITQKTVFDGSFESKWRSHLTS